MSDMEGMGEDLGRQEEAEGFVLRRQGVLTQPQPLYPQHPVGQMPVARRKSAAPAVLAVVGALALLAAVGLVIFLATRPPVAPPDKPDGTDDTPTDVRDDPGEAKPAEEPTQPSEPLTTDSVTGDDAGMPTADDFAWASAAWIKEGHVPERATRLTDLETVLGGWKGYIRYEPATADDELVEEFLSVTVGGDRTSATLLFDWGYAVVRNGAARYDDAAGDSEFLGTWDGDAGAIYATCESGNLEMKRFWDEDGRQYAYGAVTLPDGAVGDVYLTRP